MFDYELSSEEQTAIESHFAKIGLPRAPVLTFRDVAIKPRYNEIRSRFEVNDFSAPLIGDLVLKIPLLGANMKSVVNARFASALARDGGLACYPQDISIEEQLAMIDETRRISSALIDDPLVISKEADLAHAKSVMTPKQIWSLIVIDDEKKPIGVLSSRDWRYETNESKKVSELMNSGNLITAPLGITNEAISRLLRLHKIEKLPLVDKQGKLAGLITAHGFFYTMHHPRALRDEHGRFPVMGTIGVGYKLSKKLLKQVEELVGRGIKFLLIDAARGCAINPKEVILGVKKHFPNLPILAGNISTPEEARFLIEWGVDVIKIGQGPGFACRTREHGIGIPQLTAVAECSAIANLYGKRTVADGGMQIPADFIKALIAGAAACMAGKWFMSTYEAAATLQDDDGLPFKLYRGSASLEAQMDRVSKGSLNRIRRPEGQTKKVIVTGTLEDKVEDLLDAFRSEMAYVGARNISELREKSVLRWQTPAGSYEGLKR